MFGAEIPHQTASLKTLAESVFRDSEDIDFVKELLNFCPLLLYSFQLIFLNLNFDFNRLWNMKSGQKIQQRLKSETEKKWRKHENRMLKRSELFAEE